MFSKLATALIVLSALCGSHASPATSSSDELPYVLPGLGNGPQSVTASFLGSDANGHATWSLGFAVPVTTGATATAADTTITAGATLVDGSSDAHLVEILTVESRTVTFSEDCVLQNGVAVCTIVNADAATTASTVVTVTSPASGVSLVTNAPGGQNGAGRIGASAVSALAMVVAGVVVGAAMV